VRAEDIRAFVERPFAEIERLKREHWASFASAKPQSSTLTPGELLYEHAREVDSGFPSADYSRQDWEHHLRLKELIDRAQAAVQGRRSAK
jgi:hypothetical protein